MRLDKLKIGEYCLFDHVGYNIKYILYYRSYSNITIEYFCSSINKFGGKPLNVWNVHDFNFFTPIENNNIGDVEIDKKDMEQ